MTTARPSAPSPTPDSRTCFASAEEIRAAVRSRTSESAVRLALSREVLRTSTQRSGQAGAAAG